MAVNYEVAASGEEAVAAEQARLEEEEQRRLAEQTARLDKLGTILFEKRREAVEFRQASGIEDEWVRAEQHYEGYDEVSQPEHGIHKNWRTKPPGQASVVRKDRNRSTVFLNITRPFTDAAAARCADMLFPTDDSPWGLKPTPVPELIEAKQSKQPVLLADGRRVEEGALVSAILEIADKKAKAAAKRIEDWLVECQWHAEGRRIILDASKLGTGILKGPLPRKTRKVRIDANNGGQVSIAVMEKISPASKRVSCWNLYPDPGCGENIHDGSYVWERDDISSKGLRDVIGLPGYIESQVKLVLEEGPQMPTVDRANFTTFAPDDPKRNRYDIWYFTGIVERADLEAAGCDCSDMHGEQISAVVTMVNNRVIKAALNPLDSGEFPYDVLCWQVRDGFWAGIGVAEQISVPQEGVNAGARALMDNAGPSSGAQIIVGSGVEPVDKSWTIGGGIKLWKMKPDADIRNAKDAFFSFEIPSRQQELLAIVEFYLRMAEDVTGLPMLLQGQQGQAPDTVGGMTMLHNNASSVLRRLARLFDDKITEPHIGRYYDWLMQYGENPEEKGDFTIDAKASSVLVEREVQNQIIVQMYPLTNDPGTRLDKNKYTQELLRAQKLDPKRFQYDEDEWSRIEAAMAEQPDDPRVAIAQMQLKFKEWTTQFEAQWKAQQNEKDRALKAGIAELMAEVQLAEQQGQKSISIDSIRGKLADTTIKTRTQERISARSAAAKEITKPPTEPAGRAKPGRAYEH